LKQLLMSWVSFARFARWASYQDEFPITHRRAQLSTPVFNRRNACSRIFRSIERLAPFEFASPLNPWALPYTEIAHRAHDRRPLPICRSLPPAPDGQLSPSSEGIQTARCDGKGPSAGWFTLRGCAEGQSRDKKRIAPSHRKRCDGAGTKTQHLALGDTCNEGPISSG
jgi:hypothetical protein